MAAAFSHVIFDLDGTILNTLEDLAAAGNHTCEAHGWPTFAVDEYRYKVGNGMLKLVERFMPAEYAGDSAMFERTYHEFCTYYAQHKEDHTHVYPGINSMLERIKQAGVRTAVLTNKDHDAALPLAEKYFGDKVYRAVIPRTVRLSEAPSFGMPINFYEPNGKGCEAYMELAREFLANNER